MTKDEAIQKLIELRYAVDSLPDDAKIVNFAGEGWRRTPDLHVDRRSVDACERVEAERWDMNTVERFRTVNGVRVFCLVQSPIPEGV